MSCVDISSGELIDKITILEIKADRLRDPVKLRNVQAELDVLHLAHDLDVPTSEELDWMISRLRKINQAIWDAIEEQKACERTKDFGPRFVDLSRSVYQLNDDRASVKRMINTLTGSMLVEEKSS